MSWRYYYQEDGAFAGAFDGDPADNPYALLAYTETPPPDGNAVFDTETGWAAGTMAPFEVTPLRLTRAIRAAGHEAAFEAALATDVEKQRDFERANAIRWGDPDVDAVAAAVGISEEDLAAIFIAARD